MGAIALWCGMWGLGERSTDTVCLQPLMGMVKCLSAGLITGYGPLYGGCSGLCTAQSTRHRSH